MCVICKKKLYNYQPGSNIIIVYCKQITHAHTHARTHARTHTHRRRRSGCRCLIGRWRPTVTKIRPFSLVPLAINGRMLLHSNEHWLGRPGCDRDPVSPRCWFFFAYKEKLGRSETRTRDRMCFQSIRTV